MQKGHFLSWLPLLTPLLRWKEWLQISIIKLYPSLGFIGWLWLTCGAWLFTKRLRSSSSFLWTAGPWRLGGGVSWFWEVSSPLVVSGSTEMLQILCLVIWSVGPLLCIRPWLHQIKYFCELLFSVPFQLVCFQDVVRLTEIPADLCQACPWEISLLLGLKLADNLKSGFLRLGGILLYMQLQSCWVFLSTLFFA